MLRRLLLLALTLGSVAHAAAQPRIEFAVAPAWKGWSRPGRATEVDIRLSTDAATRVALGLVAGNRTVHAEIELQPGRAVRLQLPAPSATTMEASVSAPGVPLQRRTIALSQSESPLLGVALAGGGAVQLDAFHSAALGADDLPRTAAAYSSIDALVVDAATLGALDQAQLGALLAHAAACGRIVVVHADARVRRLLEGAGGCGGQALMQASTLADARPMLESSLSASLPTAMSLGSIGELARPGLAVWRHVAVGLAVYFAAAMLGLVFFTSWPLLLAAPVLAAGAALALLHSMQQPSQLVVWSEGESGAPAARYQAWQSFPGVARARSRVAVPAQLAPSVQPCDAGQPLRLDFEPGRGRVAHAGFETRLFHQVWLCYSGSFPMARAFAIETRADGSREVRNAGAKSAPQGVVLAGGLVHDLPGLAPGAHATLVAQTGPPVRAAEVRTAMTRIPPEGAAALWALDLGGVAEAGIDSKGWLLVSLPAP